MPLYSHEFVSGWYAGKMKERVKVMLVVEDPNIDNWDDDAADPSFVFTVTQGESCFAEFAALLGGENIQVMTDSRGVTENNGYNNLTAVKVRLTDVPVYKRPPSKRRRS